MMLPIQAPNNPCDPSKSLPVFDAELTPLPIHRLAPDRVHEIEIAPTSVSLCPGYDVPA